METFNIDAKGRSVGNVASEVAKILRGKTSPAYTPHKIANVKVVVTNASGVKISGNKMTQKHFTRYTGYPGGLIHSSMKNIVAKKGYSQILKDAIKGMLPANRHKSELMKKLTVSE